MSHEEVEPLLGSPALVPGHATASTSADAPLLHVVAHGTAGANRTPGAADASTSKPGADLHGSSRYGAVEGSGERARSSDSGAGLAEEGGRTGSGGGRSEGSEAGGTKKRAGPAHGSGVPCATVAGVLGFFFVVALLTAGVWVYDKFFVTPNPSWLPLYHAGRLLPCPFNHSHSGFQPPAYSRAPPTPFVTRNNTWSADMCWYRKRNTSRADTFVLEVDNWWKNQTGVYYPVYRGPNWWTTIDHLLPDTEYHFRVKNVSAHNVSTPYSPSGTIRTFPRGACGNRQDLTIFRDKQSTMKAAIQQCMFKCIVNSNKRDCTTSCITRSLGLSTKCSNCWYEEGSCTANKCIWQCLNPKSTACSQCSKEHCFPACVVCSGVERWAFPP